MLEKDVQKPILRKLEGIPNSLWIKVIRANRNGYPDIVGHIAGHAIYIEVKRPGRVADPLQRKRIAEIRQTGGIAFVACSWEECKEVLGGMGFSV